MYNEAPADIVAQPFIWSALYPNKTCGGLTINMADKAVPFAVSVRWLALVKYFSLEGFGPVNDPSVRKPSTYLNERQYVLAEHYNKTIKCSRLMMSTLGATG